MEILTSPPGADPIVVEGWCGSDPARVFRAWTEPEEIKKWFGYRPNFVIAAEIDLRPGGAWRFSFPPNDDMAAHGFEGAYETIAPAERLCFTWRRFLRRVSGEESVWPYSQVEVAFTAKGAGTQLRIVHRALGDAEKLKNVHTGWNASMRNLDAHLAAG